MPRFNNREKAIILAALRNVQAEHTTPLLHHYPQISENENVLDRKEVTDDEIDMLCFKVNWEEPG